MLVSLTSGICLEKPCELSVDARDVLEEPDDPLTSFLGFEQEMWGVALLFYFWKTIVVDCCNVGLWQEIRKWPRLRVSIAAPILVRLQLEKCVAFAKLRLT